MINKTEYYWHKSSCEALQHAWRNLYSSWHSFAEEDELPEKGSAIWHVANALKEDWGIEADFDTGELTQ